MRDGQPIFVTGGAGYVGGHACKALRLAGFLPVTFDDLSTGHAAAVKWGPLVQGDIRDAKQLDAAFRQFRPEAVLHFAARAYVGESVIDPSAYYQTNVLGSLSLLEAMRRHQVDRIVFSSTCATYGVPVRQPISESQRQQPVNPYGHTKLAVERMLADYGKAYGLKAGILRYFNAAGADPDGELGEDHDPEPHLIPNVLAATACGKSVTVHGDDYPTADGTCIRDYIHVSDLARAHVAALGRLLEGGDSFACNLGTGRGSSVRQIIDTVEQVTGRTVAATFGPRRAGDPPALVANTVRARRLLAWTAVDSDLENIIRTAWHWHSRKRASVAA